MIFVMLLAGVEKLINLAIRSDKRTMRGLQPLTGKSMRLIIKAPDLKLDIIFNHDSIRFEQVKQNIFEEQYGYEYFAPDCVVTVDNPVDLINLMRSPEGNLPIEGDYKVLMSLRVLIAGFDPDIVAQLEPFIGVIMASQLRDLIEQLQHNVTDTAKNKLSNVADWATDVNKFGSKNTPEEEAEFQSLNQKLLTLRADIEREEARLHAIKAEQARLQSH